MVVLRLQLLAQVVPVEAVVAAGKAKVAIKPRAQRLAPTWIRPRAAAPPVVVEEEERRLLRGSPVKPACLETCPSNR